MATNPVPRAAWVDASNGAAGDMLLGALLDAGASRAAVEEVLAALSAATGETASMELSQVRRHGLTASRVHIDAPRSTVHRGLADVLAVLDAARLEAPVREFAGSVFELLADAEARVHGVHTGEVAFHEVGALDALADVAGCSAALHSLGLLEPGAQVTVSAVALGGGSVTTAHGTLPVPVPAVVRLLADAGAPVSAGPGGGELCTPTGAALLAAVATGWGPLPPMVLAATGSGAGSRDPASHPNVVRVLTGEPAAGPAAPMVSGLRLVESTVDDLDPRLWPDALAAVQAAGAADAWLTPVLMRNGRPGHVISVLTDAQTADAVVRALFRATTTLGARISDVQRVSLPRDMVEVDVAGQVVRVKRGFLDGVPVTVQPEFADARQAAGAAGLPVAEVIERARERARQLPGSAVSPGR